MAAGIVDLTREEVERFLSEQVVGRIGCHADDRTYVVPVIYAYEDGAVHVYTVDGQKVAMMRANPDVCFEVDEYDRDGRGSWRSVIAYGRYEELDGDDAAHVRELLATRFRRGLAEDEREARAPRGGGRPAVAFRIVLRELTGRAIRR